jgi:diguanylate cyclase (GGDEF)-like protein
MVKGECNCSLLLRSIRYAIERKRVEEHFRHLATHDPLTGLPNRSLFYDRLSQAMHHAERNRLAKIPKWKMAIMLMDLDGFKAINDNMGHAQGDLVLQLAAQRLTSALRGSDTVARLGGDEFITIIEGVLSQEDCLVVAQKMLGALNKPVLLATGGACLHASIGVSIFPDDATQAEALVQHADKAMYTAKRKNNQVCFYRDPSRA